MTSKGLQDKVQQDKIQADQEEERIRALAGNQPKYSPENVPPMDNSPLRGKTVCFLGSSVTYGAASLGISMAEYLERRLGVRVIKEAVSGTTLVDNGEDSYWERLKRNISPSEPISLLILQLSTNDATRKLPLGQVSDGWEEKDFDTSTVTGAVEAVLCYVRTVWHCPVMIYTECRYESKAYAAMVERLPSLVKKWGIGVIDLWHDRGFNDLSPEKRSLYMADAIHPTKAGYQEWWTPEMEKQILRFWNHHIS